MFRFVYNDGNNGAEIEFTTLEAAVDAAEIKWDYLTEREKFKYTDGGAGAQFMVVDDRGAIFWEPITGIIKHFIAIFKDGDCVGSFKILGEGALWDSIEQQHPRIVDILDEVEVYDQPILPLLDDDEIIEIFKEAA